jgi:hypothetical protein
VDNPQIVVVALVEKGGHGSSVAAPVVRRVMEAYFKTGDTGWVKCSGPSRHILEPAGAGAGRLSRSLVLSLL